MWPTQEKERGFKPQIETKLTLTFHQEFGPDETVGKDLIRHMSV